MRVLRVEGLFRVGIRGPTLDLTPNPFPALAFLSSVGGSTLFLNPEPLWQIFFFPSEVHLNREPPWQVFFLSFPTFSRGVTPKPEPLFEICFFPSVENEPGGFIFIKIHFCLSENCEKLQIFKKKKSSQTFSKCMGVFLGSLNPNFIVPQP